MNYQDTNCGQNPLMIQEGDKVVVTYGAMFPEVEGYVAKAGWSTCQVMYEDGAVKTYSYDEFMTGPIGKVGVYLV